jgi:hypothetical protein
MTRNSNSDRSPTCCSSGLKNISRKESEDALTLDGKTIKVATEQFTAITDPDHTQRAVSREEEQSMYKDYVQDLTGNFRSLRSRSKLPIYRDARFELRDRRSPG